MRHGFVVAAAFLLLGSQQRFDPVHGSLARQAVQPIYAADTADAWNQLFFLLFTRTVSARVVDDRALPFAAGDERLAITDRRVTRIESGDRAVDPLYPSWTWMNSTSFDFAPNAPWRVLQEPAYSQVRAALEAVRRTAGSKTRLARAVMQADLWSVHDTLQRITSPRARGGDGAARAAALLPLVVSTMRALALTRGEIGGLPDTFSAAAKSAGLPDVRNSKSGWMEIKWYPTRSHDEAARFRRASRVFLKPLQPQANPTAFLDGFREAQGDHRGALDSVALLTQLLLVARDGTVAPSPIAFELQLRGNAARSPNGEVPQYELSRRRLLASPATGGLVAYDFSEPSYMPIAGNDFSFAAPPRLDGEAVVAPLSLRCAVCHGGAGVGHLMTFSRITAPGRPLPHVERLNSGANTHARSVATLKMEQEDYKALMALWR